jgi:hypothetical protein
MFTGEKYINSLMGLEIENMSIEEFLQTIGFVEGVIEKKSLIIVENNFTIPDIYKWK